jgi:hypothetical protein
MLRRCAECGERGRLIWTTRIPWCDEARVEMVLHPKQWGRIRVCRDVRACFSRRWR